MAEEVVDQTVDTGGSSNDGATPGSHGSQTPPGTPPPVAPANSAWEAEKRGILADLAKERKSRQAYEAQAVTHQTELAQERRRVQALAGVNPQSEKEAEEDQVRARFGQLYPGLAKLTDKQIERILSVAERADSLEEATSHHWQTHGNKMLESVVTAVASQLGGKMSDRQTNRIKQAYVAEAEANPEFLRRHEQGDPTLIEEFVKNWNEDFFEPARRKAVATEADRMRRVPSGRDRSVASTGGKKLDFNDPKAVEDAFVQSFKNHGGAFGE